MGTASTRARRSPSAAAPESSPALKTAQEVAPTLAAPAPELTRALLPCEIRVVDEEAREIELCATSEALDAHGTIFGYEASRDAFSRWVGNVREMHERKAVGRRVAVRYDDDAKRVYVRVRISKGADDTWEKVKDGTLSGASIGASNVTWRRTRMGGAGGQDVPYATRYDLVELSLVDSPSNPDASGVTFVRVIADGAADQAVLGELAATLADEVTVRDGVEISPVSAASHASDGAGDGANFIREGAGALSDEDPAAAIAQAALRRGQAQVSAALPREADAVAGQDGSGLTANELRLARLGAPAYAARVAQGLENAANMQLSSAENGSASRGIPPAVEAPGAAYDDDGDHDGGTDASGNAAGLEHADDLHAHAAHDHPHSGVYDDRHVHSGPHLHLDGTSHTHDHGHDHGHHDHASMSERSAERAQAGHSHDHVHTHDHGHFYRVADGLPRDERLVTGEQLRTREYVSELAFRTAGGVAGAGLSVAQYRIAAGVELRLELAAAERAQGAFSRNPLGAADIGTPAEAEAAPTAQQVAASATGNVRELDRDGQPASGGEMDPGLVGDDGRKSGQLDVAVPPDGFMELTDQRASQAVDQRSVAAEFTASVTAELSRVTAAMTSAFQASLGDIQQRLARIEAQPMPGGPALRVADRGSALAPGGQAGAQPSSAQQIETLGALAGRIRDPQAQVAVAAEMIRLQQEAAGMPASYQVMPRAGRGWAE